MDDVQEVKRLTSRIPDASDDEVAALRQRIVDEAGGISSGRRRHGLLRRLPARVLVPAIAAALTGAVIVSASLFGGADEPQPAGPNDPGADRSVILTDAAAELGSNVEAVTIPRLDQWRYKRFTGLSAATGQYEEEEWVRADFELAAYYEGAELRTSDGGGGDMNELDFTDFKSMTELYEFFEALPDEPSAALEEIYGIVDTHSVAQFDIFCPIASEAACEKARNSRWHRDYEAYRTIQRLLLIGVPPAGIQAKLFRTMREIPGVEDEGRVTDITGKEVLAVSWRPPFDKHPDFDVAGLIYTAIDPDTSTFRGTLSFLGYPDSESTPVEESIIILDSGFTNEPGQRP